MENRQKMFILTALSIAVLFLLARPYIFKDNTVAVVKPVKQLLEEAFAVDKPLAVVFTYGAECCPSTEAFYSVYDLEMRLTLAKFDIESVWLNVGVESKADQEEILALTRRYSVTQVPSLLILDKDRVKVGLIEGELNQEDAENLLRMVVGS